MAEQIVPLSLLLSIEFDFRGADEQLLVRLALQHGYSCRQLVLLVVDSRTEVPRRKRRKLVEIQFKVSSCSIRDLRRQPHYCDQSVSDPLALRVPTLHTPPYTIRFGDLHALVPQILTASSSSLSIIMQPSLLKSPHLVFPLLHFHCDPVCAATPFLPIHLP